MVKRWDSCRWQAEIVGQTPVRSRVDPGVPVEVVPARWFEFYPFAQLRRFAFVQRKTAEYAPDVLHTYFFWSIMYGRALKLLGRVKVLVENREDQGFNWGAHEYFLLRRTRFVPDRVICVSEAVRNVVIDKEGLDSSRVLVIHNGLDMQSVRVEPSTMRDKLGFNSDHLVVGMVANFDRPVKGASYLIDAIPAIIQAVPCARFLLVGRGDLRGRARALGVEPYVTFAGFQSDIHRYYAAMDISVLTSLSEGLSITLLESMMHKLPVVATNVGGNPEVVIDGTTGFLVPPKDVGTFVDKVVCLLNDTELRARMGQKALQLAETNFRMDLVAESYLRIHEELVDNADASPGIDTV